MQGSDMNVIPFCIQREVLYFMKKIAFYILFLLFCIPQLSFAQNNIMVAVAANLSSRSRK